MGSGHIRADMANLFNKRVMFVFNMRTCLTRLTRLAYKVIIYIDIIASLMVCFYMFITIFIVIIVF